MKYPLRVMVISTEDFSGGAFGDITLRIGNIFTAVGECIGYGKHNISTICYELEEFSDTDAVFDKRNFAILPEQSADQINEAEKEGIVPNPNRNVHPVFQDILNSII